MTAIALACQNHCRNVYKVNQAQLASDSTILNFINKNVVDILENISFTFANNYVELLASIYSLQELMENNSNVSYLLFFKNFYFI